MEPLFSTTFPPGDKLAWLAQVRKELKDDLAPDTLRWQLPEGFAAEPYYTADEVAGLPLADIQAAQKVQPGWLNAPEYVIDDQSDNARLRDALSRGADALVLSVSDTTDLTRLLHGIKLSETPVYFRLAGNSAAFVRTLKTVAPYQIRGGLLPERITNPATLAEATRLTADSPQFRTIGISGHDFHNAGATATQELAFTLARLAEQYDALARAGLTIDELVPKTWLSVSVGTSYFTEIARLRALRVLLKRFLLTLTQPPTADYSLFTVHCQTSTFYDATATPYTNLLRATTEAMAAVIGGCDLLTVHPYDTVLDSSTEFSERIARNVSVLLKEESYLDKVADPSAGSYYVETLTHGLAERAWTLFEQVQTMGGLTRAFEMGFVQTEIEQSYQAKVEAVQNGKVLVGVNKFRFDEEGPIKPVRSPKERSADQITGLTKLPNRRLSEPFE